MKKSLLILAIIISVLCFFGITTWASRDNSVGGVSVFGSVTVDKQTNGDVVAVFGNIDVKEMVNGNVVAIFGNVNINAPIAGDSITVLGNSKVMKSVSGDYVTVMGDYVTVMGDSYAGSKINGGYVTVLGKAVLDDGASIEGDVVSIGGLEEKGTPTVLGQKVTMNMGVLVFIKVVILLVTAFVFFFVGLITIAIFKKRAENVSLSAEENIPKRILEGIIGLIGILILSIILSLIVIGPVFLMCAFIVTEIACCILIGKLSIKMFKTCMNVYLEFAAGVVILNLLRVLIVVFLAKSSIIPFISISILFEIIVKALGMGILIDTKFGKKYADYFPAFDPEL